MRIVFFSVANVPSQSAESVFTMKLAEALVGNGHDVLVMAQGIESCEGDLSGAHAYYGVAKTFEIRRLPPLLPLPGRRFVNAAIGAWQARRWGATVAYGRNVFGCYWAAVMGLPTLLELHSPMLDSGKAGDFVLRKLLRHRRFARLVVITESLKQYYMGQYGLAAESITVLPDAASEPGPGDALVLDTERLQVGYIGQLYPGKGAEIISALARRLPWADFHCVGGLERDIAYWRGETADLGNVTFHGHIPYADLNRYRRSFDVMLAPYLDEVHGFDGGTSNLANWMSPMKLFEYMAAGKPAVCTDLAVIREIVEDQKTALLCGARDLDAWATALTRLRDDRALREALGRAALEEYRGRYSWPIRAATLAAAFDG